MLNFSSSRVRQSVLTVIDVYSDADAARNLNLSGLEFRRAQLQLEMLQRQIALMGAAAALEIQNLSLCFIEEILQRRHINIACFSNQYTDELNAFSAHHQQGFGI